MKTKLTISTYEFFKMFPDEESARIFFEDRRWKDGSISCPKCNAEKSITTQI